MIADSKIIYRDTNYNSKYKSRELNTFYKYSLKIFILKIDIFIVYFY